MPPTPVLLLMLLGQHGPTPGPLATWPLAERLVAEQAVYEARTADTLDDLCRAQGVEQEGFFTLRDGELRYRGDGECWDLPFRAERVERNHAVGAFELPGPDGEPALVPCAHGSCRGRHVQLWREGEALVVRGALARLGGCGVPDDLRKLEPRVGRFVPEHRLASALARRAAALGVDLRRCGGKTLSGARLPGPKPMEVSEPLRAAARRLAPEGTSDMGVEHALQEGTWSQRGDAVALSFPGRERTTLLVVLLPAGGAPMAVDVSAAERASLEVLGGPLAEDSDERVESVPLRWTEGAEGLLRLKVLTRVRRSSQMRTTTRSILIARDGAVRLP